MASSKKVARNGGLYYLFFYVSISVNLVGLLFPLIFKIIHLLGWETQHFLTE